MYFSEFFQTERSHVRNLKVLERLFFRPLIDSSQVSKDLIERLFPNLDDVLTVHNKYNQKMKERIKAGFPIGNIGDILTEMVRISTSKSSVTSKSRQMSIKVAQKWFCKKNVDTLIKIA